jgi:hypothetical protein
MRDSYLIRPGRKCGKCQTRMIFQPGCCGNLPVWRCPGCGRIDKWQEKAVNVSLYLKLK